MIDEEKFIIQYGLEVRLSSNRKIGDIKIIENVTNGDFVDCEIMLDDKRIYKCTLTGSKKAELELNKINILFPDIIKKLKNSEKIQISTHNCSSVNNQGELLSLKMKGYYD